MMKGFSLFVRVLSPLHVGKGQGVGTIDLPLLRERTTGVPYLPGSSLKGVLREACNDKRIQKDVFGPDSKKPHEHAGSVNFLNQRLLLLPVRSIKGTFAWVTSPYLLWCLIRSLQSISQEVVFPPVLELDQTRECYIASKESLINVDGRVILEDLDPEAQESKAVTSWGEWLGEKIFSTDEKWKEMFISRLCVVHDDMMNFFLQNATKITSSIRLLEDYKVVKRGGLWYQEALPTETILTGLVHINPVPEVRLTESEIAKELSTLTEKPLQFGGRTNVGLGLCKLQLGNTGRGF